MNQTSSEIRVLVTGAWSESEFETAFDLQHCRISFVHWQDVQNRDPQDFDLALVAQSRRNQFSEQALGAFASRWLLVSKALITGSWCEGETRSGHPFVGLHRIRLSDWPVASGQLIDELLATGTCWLGGPLTELELDRQLRMQPEAPLPAPLKVGLFSHAAEALTVLSDFCDSRGWTVVPWAAPDDFDVALIDCYYSIDECLDALGRRDLTLGDKPIVALLGFCRPGDRQALVQAQNALTTGSAGKSAPLIQVMPKPFDNDLLERAINRSLQNGAFRVVNHVA